MESLRQPDEPVHRHPGHDLRVGKMPPGTAHFPHPFVRLAPVGCQEVEQPGGRAPVAAVHIFVQPGFARPVERVDGFAVHVELELPRRRVADPHGPAALVAGQMRQLELRQVAFAQRTVEDLEVRRVAADGAQQPVAPRARLVEETGPEQRVEREGGVAQPAVAVIPVAAAAELLGQAGGRRGHDAAARAVGQRLEREQGAPERVAPFPVAAGGAA